LLEFISAIQSKCIFATIFGVLEIEFGEGDGEEGVQKARKLGEEVGKDVEEGKEVPGKSSENLQKIKV